MASALGGGSDSAATVGHSRRVVVPTEELTSATQAALLGPVALVNPTGAAWSFRE
jgi:hypothetical protein